MSIEIPGTVVLVSLLIPVGLLFAFAHLPRWYARSRAKHALWRLRDDVVDDKLAGRLPANHPAVRELQMRVQWAIGESRSFDLLHLVVWRRAIRKLPAEVVQILRKAPDLDGLTHDQSSRVESYRRRYNRVAIKATLLTSWIGVAILFRVGVPLLIYALRHRARETRIHAVVQEATDEIVTKTRLGRSAREFVTVTGPLDDCEGKAAAKLGIVRS